jgi:hypothetical protein
MRVAKIRDTRAARRSAETISRRWGCILTSAHSPRAGWHATSSLSSLQLLASRDASRSLILVTSYSAMPAPWGLRVSSQSAWLALPVWPHTRLDEVQEPGRAGGKKREAEEDWGQSQRTCATPGQYWMRFQVHIDGADWFGPFLPARPGNFTPEFFEGGATAENFAASRCGSEGHATYRQKSRNR